MTSNLQTTTAANNTERDPSDRCRLVLIADGPAIRWLTAPALVQIFQAGDVASVIFSTINDPSLAEAEFQEKVGPLVEASQSLGVAAIIADHSRVAGRVRADGLQLGQDKIALRDAIEKFTPSMMIGAAGVKTRHTALEIGELQPDYVMFGKPGGDIRPEPHPKNLDLGNWWSAIIEIPCIVMGGSSIESALEVARCGADFVALGTAIFAPDTSAITIEEAARRVADTNQMLDDHAPPFEIPED